MPPARNIFPTTVALLGVNRDIIDRECDGQGERWARWARWARWTGEMGDGSLLAHSAKGIEGVAGIDSVNGNENAKVVEDDDTVSTQRWG
jgi:hypothetical protein